MKILIMHRERQLESQSFKVMEEQEERQVISDWSLEGKDAVDKYKNEREIIFKTSNQISMKLEYVKNDKEGRLE